MYRSDLCNEPVIIIQVCTKWHLLPSYDHKLIKIIIQVCTVQLIFVLILWMRKDYKWRPVKSLEPLMPHHVCFCRLYSFLFPLNLLYYSSFDAIKNDTLNTFIDYSFYRVSLYFMHDINYYGVRSSIIISREYFKCLNYFSILTHKNIKTKNWYAPCNAYQGWTCSPLQQHKIS